MTENPHTSLWATPRRVADVGAFVATVRREAGLTQGELAARIGVARRFVSELETGHTTQFVDRLEAVLRELGIHVVLETDASRAAGGRHPVADAGRGDLPRVKDLGW